MIESSLTPAFLLMPVAVIVGVVLAVIILAIVVATISDEKLCRHCGGPRVICGHVDCPRRRRPNLGDLS
jgi:hypothetical protein